MKNNLLLIYFFLFFVIISHSQNPLNKIYGDWRMYKVEMADGSPYHNTRKFKVFDSFLVISITSNTIKLDHFAMETKEYKKLNKSSIKYTASANNLVISEWASYKVEKVSTDSLVLCENFKDAKQNELIRFYLVNDQKYVADLKSKYVPKDTLYASENYTPKLKKNPGYELTRIIQKGITDFMMSGTIRLDLQNLTARAAIDDFDSKTKKDKKFASQFLKYIEKNYAIWDLSDVNHFKIIELPFYFYSVNAGKNYARVEVSFFYRPKNEKLSNDYFTIASQAYTNSDLDKATLYFAKSYEENSDATDALLNKAAINFERNKKAEACADWKILSDLGDQKAIDLYNANCK